uniref:Uncharacterized protein n=1 Tax=Ditylenchus dipsaci TaxID=166011 RepID=A0A915D353_9BILA
MVCDDADSGCLSGFASCSAGTRTVEVIRNDTVKLTTVTLTAGSFCECKVKIGSSLQALVQARKLEIQKTVHLIAKLVQDVLKDVEIQEPRFISTSMRLMDVMKGCKCTLPTSCAVLKLSDGRKRSMSLWVEFITASGYLSARKIRSRFQALVAQAIEKAQFRDKCKLLTDSSDVRLHLYDKYIVKITVLSAATWPSAEVVKEVRCEGFDLLSKESATTAFHQQQQQQQAVVVSKAAIQGMAGTPTAIQQQSGGGTNNTMEGDAWAMSMTQAENLLLGHLNRRKTLSILKTLRDRHLDYLDSPITNYIIKTLVLYECEKHFGDHEWQDFCLSDRVIGVLLQLVSYLLKGNDSRTLDQGARAAWALVRQLMLSVNALETL